jgi:hypothetical protein
MLDPRGDAARRAEQASTGRRFSGNRVERSAPPPRDNTLPELAEITGGRVWSAANGEELRRAFLALLDEVRGRYLLRFEPALGEPKGWHALEVKVHGKGRVRARRGYHDGGS